MKIYRINKKKVFIIVFILICFILFGSICIWKFLPGNQVSKIYNKVNKDEAIEKDSNESESKEVKENSIVSGFEVLEKYSEVKNKDYAFLIATNAFLEQDKEELENCDEILYMKYVLSIKDQGVVENVYTKNGMLVPLAFINYNTVLDDTCLFHGYSLPYFEARYGFIKDNESIIYGEEIKDFFPLTESKEENIFTIHEDSSFLLNLIYNDEGRLLGYAYVEQ